MKMVKSLLLGSAAGLVAVTAGQAADLPVKAKPVEYVKVCSLYGAGFYYMPGTDMCIKVGGWMRVEATDSSNQTGSLAWGPYNTNLQQRSTNNFQTRARGYITADAREQTAYGTARAYIDVGLNTSDIGTAASEGTFSSNRAFLQWAGMTAGVTQSFYDFYSAAASLYRAGFLPSEDTGDGGWWIWGYTAQLGNGLTATVSAEQRRMSQIIDEANQAGSTVFAFHSTTGATTALPSQSGFGNGSGVIQGTGTSGTGYGGLQAPDIVANLRLDQTWGSAQVMAAAHEVNALYYNTSTASTGVNNGHPSDQWGFAVGAGLRLNFPMIAQGDYFQSEVNYTRGAVKYVNNGEDTNYALQSGNQETYGVMSDCVFGGSPASGTVASTTTACNLTTAWGVNAAYEHYWTPQFHESFAGSYMAVSYNAQANAMLCTGALDGNLVGGGAPGLDGSLAVAAPGCNNNWSYWGAGSRFQYDVTKSFYLGVELVYTHMDGATTSDGLLHGYAAGFTTSASSPTGTGSSSATTVARSANNWAVTARMHKDFLP